VDRQDNDNVDPEVVDGFGREWNTFNQGNLPKEEHLKQFNDYFDIFPWDKLPENAVGFDAGCGTGRWAILTALKVGRLHCVDPSSAIEVAKKNLSQVDNCEFHCSTVSNLPFDDSSMDFGYSLGVLHHIPDTAKGLSDCVRKLKSGAPFLLYLYYAFDNQPVWYRWIWQVSNLVRLVVWRLPHRAKLLVSGGIAALVYWPLARTARLIEMMGGRVHSFPLSAYRDQSFYFMKTDALDRFGTKLEQRFSKVEIEEMMSAAGLVDIKFSSHTPFYCAVGIKV